MDFDSKVKALGFIPRSKVSGYETFFAYDYHFNNSLYHSIYLNPLSFRNWGEISAFLTIDIGPLSSLDELYCVILICI